MLALSDDLGYIHEPFNPEISVYRSCFDYWFTYVCEENEEKFKLLIQNVLQFKYSIWQDFNAIKSIVDIARIARDSYKFLRYRQLNKRPLVKDPIALFSAGWLSDTFDMSVLVLIRHPAAFVGSLKKGNTTFPFDHLLSQENLMKDHLSKYEEIIRKYASDSPDIVDQGILLWNLFHHMILKYSRDHDNWLFYRHEDLSREPVEKFGEIYSKLDLKYSSTIVDKIKEYTAASKTEKTHLKRDSESNIWSWKNRLTRREVLRIYKDTFPISSQFYTDSDWEIDKIK